jgi:HAD superfamily hydrolase (TIGR01509 family)
VSIEELARSIGLAQLGGELAHALRAELATLYAYPDVEPALSSLRERGVQIAVCSNLAAGYGQAVRNLLPQINNFVFSYKVGAVKPEPAIYAESCRRLNVAPADVLFVGDSPRCDVDAPSAIGMHGRLLSRTSGQTLPALLNINTERSFPTH